MTFSYEMISMGGPDGELGAAACVGGRRGEGCCGRPGLIGTFAPPKVLPGRGACKPVPPAALAPAGGK